MNIQEHGVGIALKRIEGRLFVELRMIGTLTHEDYELFVPVIDAALRDIPGHKMHMLADMRELEGWELHAAWDDFKFGLDHRKDFKKIAMVGAAKWEALSAKVTNLLMRGETRYFEKREDAVAWLMA